VLKESEKKSKGKEKDKEKSIIVLRPLRRREQQRDGNWRGGEGGNRSKKRKTHPQLFTGEAEGGRVAADAKKREQKIRKKKESGSLIPQGKRNQKSPTQESKQQGGRGEISDFVGKIEGSHDPSRVRALISRKEKLLVTKSGSGKNSRGFQ